MPDYQILKWNLPSREDFWNQPKANIANWTDVGKLKQPRHFLGRVVMVVVVVVW